METQKLKDINDQLIVDVINSEKNEIQDCIVIITKLLEKAEEELNKEIKNINTLMAIKCKKSIRRYKNIIYELKQDIDKCEEELKDLYEI